MTLRTTDLREGAIIRLGLHAYRVNEARQGTALRRFLDGRERVPVSVTLEQVDDPLRPVKRRELSPLSSVEVIAE